MREDAPGQICISVVAKAVTKAARSATIGRFEATLVRDRPIDSVVRSGVRALDWNETVRVPIDPNMIEWKLYIRLFGEVDREFDGQAQGSAALPEIPFLRITLDDKSLDVARRSGRGSLATARFQTHAPFAGPVIEVEGRAGNLRRS